MTEITMEKLEKAVPCGAVVGCELQEDLYDQCTTDEEIELLLKFLVEKRNVPIARVAEAIKRRQNSAQPRPRALHYARHERHLKQRELIFTS